MATPNAPPTESVAHAMETFVRLAKELEDVAAKSKLLSFNAAIVAAQAGEHGKAFFVVAEQIKGLHQRTTQASVALGAANTALRAALERPIAPPP